MSNFPSLTGKQVLRALERAGCVLDRVRGGHDFFAPLMGDP